MGGEGFEVGGGQAAFALENAVGDRAIHFQDFGEAAASEVVLFDEIFEQVEACAGGKLSDVCCIVALDERREKFEVVGLVDVKAGAGDGEEIDDFSGVVVARDIVDRPGRMKFDQSFEGGGQTGKGVAGGGGFHRCFFQWSRSYSLWNIL